MTNIVYAVPVSMLKLIVTLAILFPITVQWLKYGRGYSLRGSLLLRYYILQCEACV